ncbi:hypothetical protein [Devosia sp.]|nr:hypothetical protein [Devosia sp.]MBE0577964.1 hypothetical protein [Devosia sp.]
MLQPPKYSVIRQALPYRAWTLKSADALLTRKPLDLVVINVGVQGQQM